MTTHRDGTSPAQARQTILDYCLRKGALVSEVADLDAIPRGRGVKYNPRDVEDLPAAHPQVDMAAIVPVPDPVLGERACCCITVPGDTAPTLEAIRAYLEGNGVAKIRWPERLEIVGAMPLTATRKIIKGRLAERLTDTPPSLT